MTPSDIVNPAYRAVVENTFAADAALDAVRFVSILTPDAVFQLGGNPPVQGRESIQAVVAEVFRAFNSVNHTLRQAYELSSVLMYEADVRYDYRDGRVVTIPYANVLQFTGDRVHGYRIYIDLSSLT